MTDPDGDYGQLPPHDALAERSVLGASMLHPRALADVLSLLTVEDFFLQQNAFVFEAIQALSAAGTGVDPITVKAELEKRGKPEAGAYVFELFGGVQTATNAEYYAAIVADKSILRRVSETGTRAVQWATSSVDAEGELVLERVRAEFDRVSKGRKSAVEVWTAGDLADAQMLAYAAPPEDRVKTGWPDLDQLLGGLLPGTLTIVAARPAVGKSVVGANIATSVAGAGLGSAIFSLEMTRQELTDRILSNLGGVELTRIRDRVLEPDDMRRLSRAAARLGTYPLRIVDIADIGVAGIRTVCRDLSRTERGLSVVVVDYLQLMRPADPRAPREQQVSGISRGLKLLAKELMVPVIALAQVKRPQGGPRRPVLEDLRESGSLEQDADVVVLLHSDEEKSYELEMIVGKNRHGAKGSVSLAWAPWYARAGSLQRHSEAA